MNQETAKSKWMSIGDAAKFIGVSKDTLRRWEKGGKLIAFRSPTNRRYYTQEQLKMVMLGKTPPVPNLSKSVLNKAVKFKSQDMAVSKEKTVKIKQKKERTKKPFKLKKVIKLILVGLGTIIATSAIAFTLFYFFL